MAEGIRSKPSSLSLICAIGFLLLSFCSGSDNEIGKIDNSGGSAHHVQKHGQTQNENQLLGKITPKPDPLMMRKKTSGGDSSGSVNDLNFSDHDVHDDTDTEGDYEDYSDESSNGVDEWGKDFNKKDLDEITEIEREEERDADAIGDNWSFRGPKKIGKCCPFGQSLNSQGICMKTIAPDDKHPIRHHGSPVSWFPDRVFDVEKGNWTVPVQSEWNITAPHSIKCPPNESAEIIFDTNMFVVLNNGHLFLSQHAKDLAPLNFCVDLLIGHGRAVRSCFDKSELCKDGENCLRKCCPEKAMVREPSGSCVVAPQNMQNTFSKYKWRVIHGAPACPFGQHFSSEILEFRMDEDGSLIARTTTGNLTADFLNYCLDFFTESEALKKLTENVDSKGNLSVQPKLRAAICFQTYAEGDRNGGSGLIEVPKGVGIVYGVALLFSAICIALAAFVSWRLAELRSLHGKCQLSHLATLFCLFIMLAAVHLGSDQMLPSPLCTFFAVAIHMFALSAFLWLNLLCVNIYLTFRYLRPPLAARRDENKRLFFLCVYAWGIPVAFCLFLLALDSTEGRLEPMPRPGYGELSCLMSNRAAQFAYLFGPVGILLLLNGILFCLTAKELLCGLWRLDNSDSINFRRKSMGIVVGKMGIVMGLGWILDVLSWGVASQFPYMFYAADCFNALQGVFIFVVLIWRKRVLEILHLRRASIVKDDTVTATRPFLIKNNSINNTSMISQNGDADTSLVLMQDS